MEGEGGRKLGWRGREGVRVEGEGEGGREGGRRREGGREKEGGREGERREEGKRREGGWTRITDLHTPVGGHLPLILQIEEEILNCQSICHNIDAPK